MPPISFLDWVGSLSVANQGLRSGFDFSRRNQQARLSVSLGPPGPSGKLDYLPLFAEPSIGYCIWISQGAALPAPRELVPRLSVPHGSAALPGYK